MIKNVKPGQLGAVALELFIENPFFFFFFYASDSTLAYLYKLEEHCYMPFRRHVQQRDNLKNMN